MPYTGEVRREYQRQWMTERRQRAIRLLGGKCAWCGSVDDLEIDHIRPITKDPAVRGGSAYGSSWSWERIEHELAKCWLLCKECHRVKSRDDLPDLLHGTKTMYQRRACRCADCRAWQSARMKRWRESS